MCIHVRCEICGKGMGWTYCREATVNFLSKTPCKDVSITFVTCMDCKKIMQQKNDTSSGDKNISFIKDFEYDVAISFAGENRDIALKLAETLKNSDIRVFYDDFFKHDLWGKKLTKHFNEVYGNKAKYVLTLISKYYPIKDWTDFELSIAKEESKKRPSEFILPVKIDDTKVLGLHEDVGSLDYHKEGIDGIVRELKKKLYETHKNIEKNPNRRIKPKILKEPDRIIKPKIIKEK